MSRYHNIILAGDIMFVNKIEFFMTVSRYIKFGTVEMMKNQQNKAILAAIKHVKRALQYLANVLKTEA